MKNRWKSRAPIQLTWPIFKNKWHEAMLILNHNIINFSLNNKTFFFFFEWKKIHQGCLTFVLKDHDFFFCFFQNLTGLDWK